MTEATATRIRNAAKATALNGGGAGDVEGFILFCKARQLTKIVAQLLHVASEAPERRRKAASRVFRCVLNPAGYPSIARSREPRGRFFV
jgi:hypothetical protein